MPGEDDRPATKRDLDQLRGEVNRRFDQLRDDLIERMRDMQTEALRAFHAWARPLVRVREIERRQQLS
jgi:hypothetical protein